MTNDAGHVVGVRTSDDIRLSDWKQRYAEQLPIPLDGMWQSFVDAAQHYELVIAGTVVGYGCIDSEKRVLQFATDVGPETRIACFDQLIDTSKAETAVVATCEQEFLDACEHRSCSPPTIVALMYHVPTASRIESANSLQDCRVDWITKPHLDGAVTMAHDAIGAPADWLNKYYTERIAGRELLGIWKGERLIGTGECRPSRRRAGFADLGMIVSPDFRCQGLATDILRWLIRYGHEQGLQAICSTQPQNVAAQRAIEKAGFVQYHQILQYEFDR